MKAGDSKPRGRARTTLGRRALWLQLSLLLVVGSALALGPRLFEGQTALDWTRYHASGRSDLRPAERARQTARFATRTVELLAPSPWGLEAARLAVGVARELAPEHPAEAMGLCRDLEHTLERVSRSRWRGLRLLEPWSACRELRAAAEGRASAAPVP